MKEFIRKYEDRIHGVLSCFDRMLFRGYLPIMSGWAMAQFLDRLNQNFSSLKPFLLENSERVKNHAIAIAKKQGRPFQYLASNIKKEEAARELAQRDGIQHGLVCIFSILEPCRTFSFLFKKERPDQRPFVKSARRKCLHLYFYFMDRHLGLIINNPEEFKVRKKVTRKGKSKVEWVAMRKGVAYLFRYREVSLQANSRYLEALAVVDDPTHAKRDLDRMTTRKKDTAGRGCSGFNPLARRDVELFQSVMDGDHCLRGFTNRDIRQRLASTPQLRQCGKDHIHGFEICHVPSFRSPR